MSLIHLLACCTLHAEILDILACCKICQWSFLMLHDLICMLWHQTYSACCNIKHESAFLYRVIKARDNVLQNYRFTHKKTLKTTQNFRNMAIWTLVFGFCIQLSTLVVYWKINHRSMPVLDYKEPWIQENRCNKFRTIFSLPFWVTLYAHGFLRTNP